MQKQFHIIEADSESDFRTVRNLFLEYAHWLGVDLSFQDFSEELKTLDVQYKHPLGAVLILKYGEVAVGCIGLRKFSQGIGEIKRLFIRGEFRGRGWGKMLVRGILEIARELKYKCLKLDTLADMIPAIELYKSFGFRIVEPYRYNPHQDAVFMELKLD